MAAENLRQIGPHDHLIEAADGRIVGVQIRRGQNPATRWATLAEGSTAGSYTLQDPEGGILALSEVSAVVTLTATGTAVSGACKFGGFVVRSESGGTADVTIYDALSATGTAIMTVANVSVGAYFWLGDHATAGVGVAGRRANGTGCHVVISGTATIDVLAA